MTLRCLDLFENSIKTKASSIFYNYHLNMFLKWTNLNHESLLALDSEKIEDTLQDYVMYLKRRVRDGELSPNSIADMVLGVFKFLKVNRKKFDKEIITQLYPERVKPQGDRAITDDEIRQLLEFGGIRDKAIVHLVSATGARPEAICELKIKHITKLAEGFTKLILYADDFKHEMITFLHPEASHALEEFHKWRTEKGEKLTDESYVISNIQLRTGNLIEYMTPTNLQGVMNRLFSKARIKRIKTGRRFDLATFTGFRKRFDTKLEMNPNISTGSIQCFMDHTGYLSGHYRKPTEEELLREYKKAVSSLVLSKEWKLKLELHESKTEISVVKDKRIDDLESTVNHLEVMLYQLTSRLS
jgi:integrase